MTLWKGRAVHRQNHIRLCECDLVFSNARICAIADTLERQSHLPEASFSDFVGDLVSSKGFGPDTDTLERQSVVAL